MSATFEDLEVWKRSCRMAVRLYALLKNCKDYGLRDQMLRAAVSIASNIAEGSERNSSVDFRRFLSIAKGSAAELRTQVYIAVEIGVIPKNDADPLIEELKSVSRMLQALASSIKNRGEDALDR
jgi:four helix bundle protein